MKTYYNKGMIDQLKKFLEDELDSSAAIKRWSMQVSAFLNTALGADEADNFLRLNDPNEYDEYALRSGHLQGLISKAEAEIHPAKSGKDPAPALSEPSVGIADARKVFVVHGRDGHLRDDFFSFLRALGLQPIEWSEALKFTGKATPYIGEALESAFKNAQAVVVLLSPDDEVRLSPELWKTNEDENEKVNRLQARPNVLFEAGMAFGTHPDRTILIEVGQVKSFSDVAGRHVVRLSNSAQKRNEIAERLRTAGCDVSTIGSDWLNTGKFDLIREVINAPNSYTQKDLTEGDIVALLDDWWPKSGGSVPDNVKVNFSEVDQLLLLPPGSTKKHIMSVASRKGFKRVSSGKVVAVFEYDVNIEDFGTYFEPDRDY